MSSLETFGVPNDERHVNLFRVGFSPPSAMSARLPADEILDRDVEHRGG